MKIASNQSYAPEFRGYRNIVTRKISGSNQGQFFTFMSMQLDNAGHRDLDLWKNLQQKVLKRQEYSDIISFSFLNASDNFGCLWLGDKLMNDGQSFLTAKFGGDESLLRACAGIHNLTENLMNENGWLQRDNSLMDVAKHACNNLINIFSDSKAMYFGNNKDMKNIATDFVAMSFINPDKPQANAGDINKNLYKVILPFVKSFGN